MGKVIYLMVRLTNGLSVEEIKKLVDWCHYSFDLTLNPIPDLMTAIDKVGDQDWLVFSREVAYLEKPEQLPLDIPNEELQEMLNQVLVSDKEEKTSTKNFKEGAIIIFRLNSAIHPLVFTNSEDLVRDAYQLAIFYAHGIWHIAPDIIDGKLSFTHLTVDHVNWGVVRIEPSQEKEGTIDKFAQTTDLSTFLKPRGESK